MRKILLSAIILLLNSGILSQTYKILESTSDHINVEFNFENNYKLIDTLINGASFQIIKGGEFGSRNPGQPWLPDFQIQLGIPFGSKSSISILNNEKISFKNKIIPPLPYEDPKFFEYDFTIRDRDIYERNEFFPFKAVDKLEPFISRYIRILPISIAPYQYNPVTRELLFNKSITIRVDYNENIEKISLPVHDPMTNDLVRDNIINYDQAVNWIGKDINEELRMMGESEWYNPAKIYYKIYLNKKGVYRLGYDYLSGLNIQLQNIETNKFQIFNNGEEVPLYIKDINNNGIFESGEYIEFVGYPPSSSPFSGFNIYNTQNVYWFSYQSDTSGLRYSFKDGYPHTWTNSFQSVPNIIHYEVDTLYERLGHASNDQRDYWYWARCSGSNGSILKHFYTYFPWLKNISTPLTTIELKVNMHGLTYNNCTPPDHKAHIYFTGVQPIGTHTWNGYSPTTYTGTVDLSKVVLYDDNYLTVETVADIPPCSNSTSMDEFLINWFEIEYQMDLRADANNINFKSPPNVNGTSRIEVFSWLRDNMKIFIPGNNKMIINPQITNNQYKSVFFTDNLSSDRVEYFCAAEDYFLLPDSVIKDKNSSNLKSVDQEADYIIITNSKFTSVAERLANFRSVNFPDTNITSPRIKIVDVEDIYDEFSFGLLNPYAIQYFNKYAFDNWISPAPTYVVLLGDMSYDYRKILPESRPNFVPSIPYHTSTYGQAASDNLFVTVSGNDVKPDIAIGRISCETVEEGNILVDKIIEYPNDNSKKWKQNVLLMSSGIDQDDESDFGFNDSNLSIDNNFLIPNGITSTKVFRFSNKPEHIPYQGETAEIRDGFNEGAIIASYYGHGGGYQWDLVFTNDDIYELENEGRLPFISSVTCYTAHFDNQDVFGEQFNKVPGKGSISFWGSSGLTYWSVGESANRIMFDEIFNRKSSVSGKFILSTKNRMANSTQINLLTLLGDPVLKLAIPDEPDFVILPSDISIEPATPIINDTVAVKVKISNYGVIFQGDSVVIQLRVTSQDTSYTIAEIKKGSFGEIDSVIINWIPVKGGLYTLIANINEIEPLPEVDHSDNEASAQFAIFEIGEPNIVDPINGYVSPDSIVAFLFIDNGYYINENIKYLIEIDTSLSFETPLVKSLEITPQRGVAQWASPVLEEGIYFWRAKVVVEEDSTFWIKPRVLEVEYNSTKKGYSISGKSLLSLEEYNMNYSNSSETLNLNTDTLPPRPTIDTFEEFMEIELSPEIGGISTITTDGTYIYYAQIKYWIGQKNSKIYKLGTGYNGTVRGQNYGSIPNLEVDIRHQMFYYPDNEGGHIYAATFDAHSLLKINIATGDTSRVGIPDGLLHDATGLVQEGGSYISSDGRYVYNLAFINEEGQYRYTLRIFDPLNNWTKIGQDVIPSGSSYQYFLSFFAANGYIYPYENLWGAGWMRKIDITSGRFEEEFLNYYPHQNFYAWTYDWLNDKVYASVYLPSDTNITPKIGIYKGTYRDAFGSVKSHQVGPAAKWNNLDFSVNDEGFAGTKNMNLLGLNSNTRTWDTLFVNPADHLDISSIDADIYSFLQLNFDFTDSSFGATEPIQLKNINIDYETLPEIMVVNEDILFNPDTVLQGLNTEIKVKVINFGGSDDSLLVNYFFYPADGPVADTSFMKKVVSVPKKSFVELIDTLSTSPYLFENILQVSISSIGNELFTFNNISNNKVFVSRDSINPAFKITFDGREILDGDIVSAKPNVVITLKDNSPLPLNESLFTIIHDSNPLNFTQDTLEFNYTPYPNSEAVVTWNPTITEDGEHSLQIFAKDASLNPFDNDGYTVSFNVFNKSDLKEVYNFPNPFGENTYFTFEIRGVDVPDELKIKVYTVAGRLIRDMDISPANLQIGFNRIYWDGRDQDGDEIANGLYFYKVIYKNNDVIKTVTQKLAKVK